MFWVHTFWFSMLTYTYVGVSALAMDEDEDDVDDLAVLKNSEESSDQDEDEVVDALMNKRYSCLPPPQGLSPMPPHRGTTTSKIWSST